MSVYATARCPSVCPVGRHQLRRAAGFLQFGHWRQISVYSWLRRVPVIRSGQRYVGSRGTRLNTDNSPTNKHSLDNRERKCADTIGTVLVPWAGYFQYYNINIFLK